MLCPSLIFFTSSKFFNQSIFLSNLFNLFYYTTHLNIAGHLSVIKVLVKVNLDVSLKFLVFAYLE